MKKLIYILIVSIYFLSFALYLIADSIDKPASDKSSKMPPDPLKASQKLRKEIEKLRKELLVVEYYNVINIKSNDVLNVRQEANPSSTLMGAISYTGKCLKYLSESEYYERMLWKKIEYRSPDGVIVGWVNTAYLSPTKQCGATSSKDKNLRNSSNFETFLNYFLNTCYWGENINTLVQNSSPAITQFYSKEITFGRYWNNGAFCRLYTDSDYGYGGGFDEVSPKNPNFKIFKEKRPKDGFCEESPSLEGIYIISVSEFPSYHKDIYDKKGDSVNMVYEKYQVPTKYKNSKKFLVMILYKKYIQKSMYFIQTNGIWHLVSFYDCDCNA